MAEKEMAIRDRHVRYENGPAEKVELQRILRGFVFASIAWRSSRQPLRSGSPRYARENDRAWSALFQAETFMTGMPREIFA